MFNLIPVNSLGPPIVNGLINHLIKKMGETQSTPVNTSTVNQNISYMKKELSIKDKKIAQHETTNKQIRETADYFRKKLEEAESAGAQSQKLLESAKKDKEKLAKLESQMKAIEREKEKLETELNTSKKEYEKFMNIVTQVSKLSVEESSDSSDVKEMYGVLQSVMLKNEKKSNRKAKQKQSHKNNQPKCAEAQTSKGNEKKTLLPTPSEPQVTSQQVPASHLEPSAMGNNFPGPSGNMMGGPYPIPPGPTMRNHFSGPPPMMGGHFPRPAAPGMVGGFFAGPQGPPMGGQFPGPQMGGHFPGPQGPPMGGQFPGPYGPGMGGLYPNPQPLVMSGNVTEPFRSRGPQEHNTMMGPHDGSSRFKGPGSSYHYNRGNRGGRRGNHSEGSRNQSDQKLNNLRKYDSSKQDKDDGPQPLLKTYIDKPKSMSNNFSSNSNDENLNLNIKEKCTASKYVDRPMKNIDSKKDSRANYKNEKEFCAIDLWKKLERFKDDNKQNIPIRTEDLDELVKKARKSDMVDILHFQREVDCLSKSVEGSQKDGNSSEDKKGCSKSNDRNQHQSASFSRGRFNNNNFRGNFRGKEKSKSRRNDKVDEDDDTASQYSRASSPGRESHNNNFRGKSNRLPRRNYRNDEDDDNASQYSRASSPGRESHNNNFRGKSNRLPRRNYRNDEDDGTASQYSRASSPGRGGHEFRRGPTNRVYNQRSGNRYRGRGEKSGNYRGRGRGGHGRVFYGRRADGRVERDFPENDSKDKEDNSEVVEDLLCFNEQGDTEVVEDLLNFDSPPQSEHASAEDDDSEDSEDSEDGNYANKEIVKKFLGSKIPSLLEAVTELDIDVTMQVKDLIIISDDGEENVFPKTLLDIILYKQDHPNATCLPWIAPN